MYSSFLLPLDLSICPSPSYIMSCFPVEEARELCCSAVSAVITKLFYAIFIFIFAVVGATLGAVTGAFVGAKTKIGCLHGAAVGAIKGSFLTVKLFKISVIVWSSDNMSTSYLLQLINPFDSRFNKVPENERLSKSSTEKIPKIRITEENIWDSSRNRICCSICLQDFLPGEIVHSLPQCHHMFHMSCIGKWQIGHKSCPLCRRNF
ncbi:NEP1-interacting protein 1-like [Durio zibethinus]|uniref:NEP1-interacting protein 1-like n=1 Tax=Durio zibethinus TaxID=66656 RepID=A0A6P6B607_DURZI|nr:NEP1-interacting protein 1-like [Durio zibethinus]